MTQTHRIKLIITDVGFRENNFSLAFNMDFILIEVLGAKMATIQQRKASSKASGMSLDSECLKWIFWKG